jgi:hypothetical protein
MLGCAFPKAGSMIDFPLLPLICVTTHHTLVSPDTSVGQLAKFHLSQFQQKDELLATFVMSPSLVCCTSTPRSVFALSIMQDKGDSTRPLRA